MTFVQPVYNSTLPAGHPANSTFGLVGVLGVDLNFAGPQLREFIKITLPSDTSQLAIVQNRGEPVCVCVHVCICVPFSLYVCVCVFIYLCRYGSSL